MKLARTLFAAVAAMGLATGMGNAQDRAGWPSDIRIGTASQGGTYSVIGNGMANLLAEKLGVNTSAEITGGPVQNVTMVQSGDHQMGFVTLGPAKEAWDGESVLAPGLEHKDIRALVPMYVTPFQVIALSSAGISSVQDLQGKRVNYGPATGTAGTYWPRILEIFDISTRSSFSGGSDAAGQLTDGLIDAIAFAGGVPIPFFSELAVQNDVKMFGLTEEELEAVFEALPAMSPFTIEAGTYAGHDYDQPTVGLWNFVIANASMPEDLAYEITKTVLENNEYMQQVHSVNRDMIVDNWDSNNVVPYHPGAVRYLQEQGIEVPAELIGE